MLAVHLRYCVTSQILFRYESPFFQCHTFPDLYKPYNLLHYCFFQQEKREDEFLPPWAVIHHHFLLSLSPLFFFSRTVIKYNVFLLLAYTFGIRVLIFTCLFLEQQHTKTQRIPPSPVISIFLLFFCLFFSFFESNFYFYCFGCHQYVPGPTSCGGWPIRPCCRSFIQAADPFRPCSLPPLCSSVVADLLICHPDLFPDSIGSAHARLLSSPTIYSYSALKLITAIVPHCSSESDSPTRILPDLIGEKYGTPR